MRHILNRLANSSVSLQFIAYAGMLSIIWFGYLEVLRVSEIAPPPVSDGVGVIVAAAVSSVVVLLVLRFRRDRTSMRAMARALRTGELSLLKDPVAWMPWLNGRREKLEGGWTLALVPAVCCLVTLVPSWNRGSLLIGASLATFFVGIGVWLVVESRIQLPRYRALQAQIEALPVGVTAAT